MAGRLLTLAVNIEAILPSPSGPPFAPDVAQWHIACYRAAQ
jgi:hypothetical protein